MSFHFNGYKAKELYFNGMEIKEAWFNGQRVYKKGKPMTFAQTFTSTGSHTFPLTAINIKIWLVGGGGGGGGWWYPENIIIGGGGGGAGGYSYKDYGDILAGTTQNFTVGQGGAGNSNIFSNGAAGGQSKFGTQIANGGGGGSYGGGGGAGGGASGGSTNTSGATGGSGGVMFGGAGATGTIIAGSTYGSGGHGYSTTDINGITGCCRIEYDYIEYDY